MTSSSLHTFVPSFITIIYAGDKQMLVTWKQQQNSEKYRQTMEYKFILL